MADTKSAMPRSNFGGGLVRLWVVVAVCWVFFSIWVLRDESASMAFGPSLILGCFLAACFWVFRGFRPATSATQNGRRVEVTGKGLLFQFRLPDETIVVIPSLQLWNDSQRNAAIASALPMWMAGMNGPLDSLSANPVIRDYLYSWAIDRSVDVSGVETRVDVDQRGLFVSPGRTFWFILPDDQPVEISGEDFVNSLSENAVLRYEFFAWGKRGPTRTALAAYPTLLEYLRQQTPEFKVGETAKDLAASIASESSPAD